MAGIRESAKSALSVYATVALTKAATPLGGGNGAAAAAAPDTVVTGPSQQLEEITVTATRRSETALDAPIAISAYSGQELKNFGVESLQDLTKIDSSIQVTNFGASQQQIVIRGISSPRHRGNHRPVPRRILPLQGGFQNNFRGDGTPGLRLIDVEGVWRC